MTPQAIVTLAADTASADATFFFRVRGERMSLEIATREPTESTLHELAALVLDRPLAFPTACSGNFADGVWTLVLPLVDTDFGGPL